jgi:hypothetical protein
MPSDDRGNAKTRRLVVAGTVATTAAVLAGAAGQLIGYGVFEGKVAALDSSTDGGVFGVIGDVSLIGAAGAAWTLFARTRPVTMSTAVLPPLLTFLAVDKVIRLHDHIHGWLTIYLPVLGGTLVSVVIIARRSSPRSARLAVIALTLLTASFLIHLFGEQAIELVAAPDGWAYQFKGITKHGAEVAGWLLLALGFVVGLQDRASSDHEDQVARPRR